ncbi:hypothetical protein G1H11_14820 [Phytoactinopolyspora alkaliphila]|uniref:Heavy-metal-associated domain-containing protein n=1 Tax=Phytoactinopolyspora alkaliphila TaxID=1783498 RepID=A0A6N9YNE0_9ACTN|nr:hypothetical protein [Phytoactinopolyspora alkaliphila]NED96581.1 hypothetical protein [Phytoactinopolyspora alkaliphila]
MKTSSKLAAYTGVLAVAFAGAAGLGNLTGSPIERPPAHEPTGHAADADDVSAAGSDAGGSSDVQEDGHADPGDGHGDQEDGHGDHGSAPAPAEAPPGLQVSEHGYTLSAIEAPERAGDAGQFRFRILGPDGEPVTEFTEAHEKDLHLIVVRTDTAVYRHVHPELDAEGVWSIDWEWATPGTYKVFADCTPTDLGAGLTLARTVDVPGGYDVEVPAESAVADVDGYTVTLGGDIAAGQTSEVTATIERDGEPVTDLEPYLGAYGHLVALREGDLAYLHVHPEGEPGDGITEPGPDVTFYVEAPTSGTYRLFLDFQVDGQVRTADFTLTAGGSGSEAAGDEPSDDEPVHDEEDGHGHADG